MRLACCALALLGCAELLELDRYEQSGAVATGGGAAGGANSGSAGSMGGAGAAPGGSEGNSYSEAVLADEPLGYWRLDDESTPDALDSSPNGNHGTYFGGLQLGEEGALASGDNRAVHFDGSGGIDFDDRFDFADVSPFTLEAWIRPDTVDSIPRGIFHKIFEGSNIQGYSFSVDDMYGLRLSRWSNGVENSVTTLMPPLAGGYSHVVASYDGVTMRIYLNGALAADGISMIPLIDNTGHFQAGRVGMQQHFIGTLDELAVYDKALSNEEVEKHYEARLR
jgi:hyaluronoglucosaminidase